MYWSKFAINQYIINVQHLFRLSCLFGGFFFSATVFIFSPCLVFMFIFVGEIKLKFGVSVQQVSISWIFFFISKKIKQTSNFKLKFGVCWIFFFGKKIKQTSNFKLKFGVCWIFFFGKKIKQTSNFNYW